MSITFTAIPTQIAEHWRNGGTDAHGQKPERRISDGGAPCRHCLKNVLEGEAVLLGAYKPFQTIGAFTELGQYLFAKNAASALRVMRILCRQ